MKKILLAVILFIVLSKFSIAQVADTTVYLQDSIVANKTYYINKSVGFLLNNLKINATICDAYVPYIKGRTDSVLLSRIDLTFAEPLKSLQGTANTSVLCIRFLPVMLPYNYFKPGAVIGWVQPITPAMKHFLNDVRFKITDIQLF